MLRHNSVSWFLLVTLMIRETLNSKVGSLWVSSEPQPSSLFLIELQLESGLVLALLPIASCTFHKGVNLLKRVSGCLWKLDTYTQSSLLLWKLWVQEFCERCFGWRGGIMVEFKPFFFGHSGFSDFFRGCLSFTPWF